MKKYYRAWSRAMADLSHKAPIPIDIYGIQPMNYYIQAVKHEWHDGQHGFTVILLSECGQFELVIDDLVNYTISQRKQNRWNTWL